LYSVQIAHLHLSSLPTRRSSDLSSSSAKVTSTHNDTSSDVGGLAGRVTPFKGEVTDSYATGDVHASNGERVGGLIGSLSSSTVRSEEHTSELQSRFELVCRLLL